MKFLLGQSKRERRLRISSALALGAGCLYLAVAWLFNPLARVQDAFTDALFEEGDASPNVVVVAIGEDELAKYGRLSSWPRAIHAEMIDHLNGAGARVITYDILFADEGPDDAELARAMADAGTVILAGAGTAVIGERDDGIEIYANVAEPPTALRESAVGIAHSHLITDEDGRVRRVPLAAQPQEGDALPALSLAAVQQQFGRPVSADDVPGSGSFELFGRDVPVESHGSMRVNYTGGLDRFVAVPFDEVLAGNVPDAVFAENIVFVGVNATGIDRHSAPLLGNAAGIEVHANATNTLLLDDFLRRTASSVTLITGVAFATIMSFVALRMRNRYIAPLGVVIVVAYLALAVAMFQRGWIINAVDPPVALAAAMVVGLVYRVASERAAQQEVIELFGRHVTSQVAAELVRQADTGELQLGGETREITALFADIRGFTTLSGGMDPSELVALLNARFSIVVDVVARHNGIVNKFIGDALVAFWNAPTDQDDHAYHACLAALEALDRLDELPDDGHAIRFGFGVNTGPALAGNVGSSGRFEYTVMGENVNTASRLSGAAGGREVWVGERTHELLAGRIECDELPPQQLKGMVAPIAMYRLHRSGDEQQTTTQPDKEMVGATR